MARQGSPVAQAPNPYKERTMVQFGWKAGAEQYEPRELLEDAVAAEVAGFDAVDVNDPVRA